MPRDPSRSRRRRAAGRFRRRRPVERCPPLGQAGGHLRRAERLGGHDQGVLVVVAVVARPDPDRPEAELLVQPAGRQVRQADLEGRLGRLPVEGDVEDRHEEPLGEVVAAPGRGDRERRDVGLVDHQPQAGKAGDLVAHPDDEVVGELVRLELGPVGIRRPGRREGRPLDHLDGRQVVEPHRLDGHPQRGSRDHSIEPLRAPTPRGRLTYSGTSRARSSASPAASRRRREPQECLAQAGPRQLAAGQRIRRRPPIEINRQQLDPGAELGLAARRQESRSVVVDQDPVARPGRQEEGPALGGARGHRRSGGDRTSKQGGRGRDPDDRDRQGLGQALRRREPHPQPGERARAGPDDDPAERAQFHAGCRSSPIDGRQELSPWRWPAGQAATAGSPPGRSMATTVWLVAVSIASSGPPADAGSRDGLQVAFEAGPGRRQRGWSGGRPQRPRSRYPGGPPAGPGRGVQPIRPG